MNSIRMALAVLAFLLATSFATEASAYTHTWCFKFAVAPQDAGVGEDFGTNATDSWIARGVKVRLRDVAGEYILGNASGGEHVSMSNGCYTFTHDLPGPFEATIYAETRINFSEDIRIRAFQNRADYDDWSATFQDVDLPHWSFANCWATCGTSTCSLTLTTYGQNDPVANMLAFATFQVHRSEDISSTKLSVAGSPHMYLINDECPASGTGSCQGGSAGTNPDQLFIQSPDGQRRKFLVGHEVGHWLHYYWVGKGALYNGMGGDACEIEAVDASGYSQCNSLGSSGQYSHMLRSVEKQGCAFVEGFAHFLSTAAYNQLNYNAWFKYYKQWSGQGAVYNYDTIDVEATQANPPGGRDDWIHWGSGCGCPSSDTDCQQYGVEMDWLRHYWDYATNDGAGTPPTFYQILDHVRDAYVNGSGYHETTTHGELESYLSGTRAIQWDSSADHNGVDPTPE